METPDFNFLSDSPLDANAAKSLPSESDVSYAKSTLKNLLSLDALSLSEIQRSLAQSATAVLTTAFPSFIGKIPDFEVLFGSLRDSTQVIENLNTQVDASRADMAQLKQAKDKFELKKSSFEANNEKIDQANQAIQEFEIALANKRAELKSLL